MILVITFCVFAPARKAVKIYCTFAVRQFLSFNPPASEPVCWSLTGYSSGWCTAFFERPLLAMEPECAGRGDANCGWLIQPPAMWGEVAKPHLEALRPLMRRVGNLSD